MPLQETYSGSLAGVPYGNRTRVAAVKGRCPRPLDERDAVGELRRVGASGLRYRNAFVAVKRRVNLVLVQFEITPSALTLG